MSESHTIKITSYVCSVVTLVKPHKKHNAFNDAYSNSDVIAAACGDVGDVLTNAVGASSIQKARAESHCKRTSDKAASYY